MKKRLLFGLFLLPLVSCDLTTINLNDYLDKTSSMSTTTNEVIKVNLENNDRETSTIEQAVAKVYDSVVVINAYQATAYSSGSGVFFSKSEDDSKAYIVTCHHVIESATTFEVVLSNGTSISASLVGGDAATDIAVLEVDNNNYTISNFKANVDDIRLAETAIAIGNPLGTLANTVTCGIVSATSREITSSDGRIHRLIQTDAAINSGNSGGGLFDITGALIGIVSSKYASTGIEGLGFAIPCDIASSISTDLLEDGMVEGRFDLGIDVSDGYVYSGYSFIRDVIAVTYVSSVDSSGCAYGKLKTNDILNTIKLHFKDDRYETAEFSVTNASATYSFLNDTRLLPGDEIEFIITRNNQSVTVFVELTQYKYTIK